MHRSVEAVGEEKKQLVVEDEVNKGLDEVEVRRQVAGAPEIIRVKVGVVHLCKARSLVVVVEVEIRKINDRVSRSRRKINNRVSRSRKINNRVSRSSSINHSTASHKFHSGCRVCRHARPSWIVRC